MGKSTKPDDKRKESKGRPENLLKKDDLTPEQRRQNASKAGQASVIAKREKKNMQRMAKTLLEMDVSEKQGGLRAVMSSLGIDKEDMDYSAAILASMIVKAAKGDVKAATFIRDTAGFKPQEKLDIDASVDATVKNDVVIYLPEIEKPDEMEGEEN